MRSVGKRGPTDAITQSQHLAAKVIAETGADALKAPVVWLQHMASGVTIDLSDPDPAHITLTDICRGLSRIRRWSGQAGKTEAGDFDFSVGQHVLSSHDSVPEVVASSPDAPQTKSFVRRVRRHLVVHDMPETYTGDIITPLKILLGRQLRAIEDLFDERIAKAIGMPVETDPVVLAWAKEIDVAASWAEMTLCFPSTAHRSRVRYTDRQVAIANVMLPHIARRSRQSQRSVAAQLHKLAIRHGARESLERKEAAA